MLGIIHDVVKGITSPPGLTSRSSAERALLLRCRRGFKCTCWMNSFHVSPFITNESAPCDTLSSCWRSSPPAETFRNISPDFSLTEQVTNRQDLQRSLTGRRHGGGSPDRTSSSGAGPTASAPPPLREPVPQEETSRQIERMQEETLAHSQGDSDSSLPSPMREHYLSSDLEASGEDSDPRPPPSSTAVWIVKRHGQKVRVCL